MAGYVLFLFNSTHHVLKAESVLKSAGIVPDVIPVPRGLSSDCGVCLKVTDDVRQRAEAALREGRVAVEAAHEQA
jgi:hypothetical protein